MPNLIFVTVGTSVVNNTAQIINYDHFFNEIESGPRSKSEDPEDPNVKELREAVTNYLLQNYLSWVAEPKTFCKNTSAELATLYHMMNSEDGIMDPAKDKIVLLNSDTLGGEMAAQIIRDVLKGQMGCQSVELVPLQGINARNADRFESRIDSTGETNFIEKVLNQIRLKNQLDADQCLICFSGGYKALIPLLSNYAKEKELDMLVLHEQSDTLIRYRFSPNGLETNIIEDFYR